MFGFAIGVMVGLLCYRLRNEEKKMTRAFVVRMVKMARLERH